MFTENKYTAEPFRDIYPSRDGSPARLLERIDPVLYAGDDETAPIAATLVKQYREQGFVILENIFSDREIALFSAELERLRRTEATDTTDEIIREPGHGDIRSIFKVHESNLLFNKLASDNRLAGLAQYLLADEIYVHQSRVNYKPGFRGKEFYWHSDFETWHIEDGMPRMRALSVSITLTENHPYNGPLLLIPGSHQYYAVCEGETPKDHYRSSLKQQQYGVPSDALLQQMAQRGGIVSATGKAGSVIVFDCNTMHGSGSNITPFPRSNVFMVYNALSNRVVEPCHGLTPRPEYLCSRQQIKAITPQTVDYGNS